MRQRLFRLAPFLAIGLALSACSQQPVPEEAQTKGTQASDTAAAADTPSGTGPSAQIPPRRLRLEGLGELEIGKPVPETGKWAERGAQISEECRTISSPDYPGVYAIVSEGTVRRITVGQRSEVELAEGIGVGASEEEVKGWFPSFTATPHAYEEAPAKYLTAPNAESGDPALRFEIDSDDKVSLIHVGTMPELAYVEGCA